MKLEFEKVSLEKCQIDLISEEFIQNHKNLKIEFEKLNENYQEKLNLLNISEDSLKQTQKILTEKTEKIGNLNDNLVKLKNSLIEKSDKIDIILKEKDECYKENLNLKEEVSKSNMDVNQFQINLSELNIQMKNLLKESENIKAEKKELKISVSKYKTEIDNLLVINSSIRQEAKKETAKFKQEIESLNNILESNNQEIENLKNELSKINDKHLNKGLLINNFKENQKKENSILKKKIDELSFQIENYVIEIGEKNILLRDYEKDNEFIKSERDKYIKFYEKEKLENESNSNLIKLLEEENLKQKSNLNQINKQKVFNPLISENNSAKYENFKNKESYDKFVDNNLKNLKIGINSCNGLLDVFAKKYQEYLNLEKNSFNDEKVIKKGIQLFNFIFIL